MAGGPTTVELVVAAAAAGALGFLAGGYKTAAAMTAEMAAVRAARVGAFGVNVFVPGHPAADLGRVEAYVASLEADAAQLGATAGPPTWDDDDYGGKVDALAAGPPAAVSFTFGIPDLEVVRSLQAAGSIVLLTVTTPEEAALALRAGPDALCLQGAEAGAHRGSLANDDAPDQDRPVRALLASVRPHTRLPLVAAGGVGGPDDVAELLARGAELVQAGTAFLRCPESGAPQPYKDALADPAFERTAITRAFSGRRARALVNAMVRDHPGAPAAYPEINNATRPVRTAAAQARDTQHMSLYAGTAFRQAEARPAGEVVERLVSGWRR
jgi:nitronate monooxygenase